MRAVAELEEGESHCTSHKAEAEAGSEAQAGQSVALTVEAEADSEGEGVLPEKRGIDTPARAAPCGPKLAPSGQNHTARGTICRSRGKTAAASLATHHRPTANHAKDRIPNPAHYCLRAVLLPTHRRSKS